MLYKLQKACQKSTKSIQTLMDKLDIATQTMPNPDSIIFGNVAEVSNIYSSKSVQTVANISDIGIQVIPHLSIDTVNLQHSMFDSPSVLRQIDLSAFGNEYVSLTSNSIQAVPNVREQSVQTLISNLNQTGENLINSDLILRTDMIEFAVHSVQTSPMMVSASEVLNLINTLF